MKRTTALLFVLALLLAIVVPISFCVNTQSVNVWSHPAIWADGGTPAPPFPDMTTSMPNLLADGGTPAPPFPDMTNSTTNLWADGGTPAPPFPDLATSFTVKANL